MKKEERTLIASWLNNDDYSYEQYVEFCKDNEIEPSKTDSEEYWDWVSEMTQMNYDDFFGNLKYSKENEGRFVITFSLGLWNGTHHGYVNEIFDNLSDAIKKALHSSRDYMDYKVSYQDGEILVFGYHHDGTNIMTIHKLSKHGERNLCGKDSPDIEKYIQIKDTFKKINYEALW